jgi:hypothetical protein
LRITTRSLLPLAARLHLREQFARAALGAHV